MDAEHTQPGHQPEKLRNHEDLSVAAVARHSKPLHTTNKKQGHDLGRITNPSTPSLSRYALQVKDTLDHEQAETHLDRRPQILERRNHGRKQVLCRI